jgi:hypothetical protein
MTERMCACGKPLHYTDLDTRFLVDGLVAQRGEFMEVSCAGKRYFVQRHYVALHGLKGAELPALAKLGIVQILPGKPVYGPGAVDLDRDHG